MGQWRGIPECRYVLPGQTRGSFGTFGPQCLRRFCPWRMDSQPGWVRVYLI